MHNTYQTIAEQEHPNTDTDPFSFKESEGGRYIWGEIHCYRWGGGAAEGSSQGQATVAVLLLRLGLHVGAARSTRITCPPVRTTRMQCNVLLLNELLKICNSKFA